MANMPPARSVKKRGTALSQDASWLIRAYSLDEITAGHVHDRYPFIGQQMLHQDFDRNFKGKWRDYFRRTGIRV